MKKLLAASVLPLLLSANAMAEDVNLSLLVAMNPGEPGYEILLEQVKTFEELYPNVKLELTASGHDEYFTKLQALTLADQLPDLIFLWPGQRTSYVINAGKVMDLMPLVKADGLEDKILPMILEPQNEQGEVFLLGNNVNFTSVIYANDAILKELGLEYPKNFEEWYAQSQVIRDSGYFPLVLGNKSSWVAQSCLLSPIVGRVAGNAWVDKAKAGEASFADAPFVDSLQVIADMRDNGLVPKAMNSLPRSKAVELFTVGKAAYYLEGAWSISEFEKIMTPEELDDVSLHILPELNGVSAVTSAVGGTSYGINKKLEGTEKAKYAWEWVKFYNGFGDQKGVDLAISGGIIPPLKAVNVNKSAPNLIKKLAALQSTLDGTTYVLDAVLPPKGIEYVNSALQELIAGQSAPADIGASYEKIARD